MNQSTEDVTRLVAQMLSIQLGTRDISKVDRTQQVPEQQEDHFRHKPLDMEQKSIRLIQFSQQADGELEFELQHFAFNETPRYRAVSYMWGSEPMWMIKINHQPFLIKENLYNLLKTMSASDNGGYLWIDQICINQTDISERNHQVSFMADVYGTAKEVIIWLGACGQEHEETAAFVNHFVVHELGSRSETATCHFRSTPLLSHSLRCFLNNPYWSRLWIVQEILEARALTIKWGAFEVKWRALCAMLLGYRHSDTIGSTSLQLRTLAQRALCRAGVNRSVFKFMSAFCGSQCQDSRDKVYGLLAITHLKLHVVDYARSKEEVFLDAAHAMDQDTSKISFEDFVQLIRTLAVEMLRESDSRVVEQCSVRTQRKDDRGSTQLPVVLHQLSAADVREMTVLQFVVRITGYVALESVRNHPASTRLVQKSFHELMLTKPMVPVILTKELRFVPSALLEDSLFDAGSVYPFR